MLNGRVQLVSVSLCTSFVFTWRYEIKNPPQLWIDDLLDAMASVLSNRCYWRRCCWSWRQLTPPATRSVWLNVGMTQTAATVAAPAATPAPVTSSRVKPSVRVRWIIALRRRVNLEDRLGSSHSLFIYKLINLHGSNRSDCCPAINGFLLDMQAHRNRVIYDYVKF